MSGTVVGPNVLEEPVSESVGLSMIFLGLDSQRQRMWARNVQVQVHLDLNVDQTWPRNRLTKANFLWGTHPQNFSALALCHLERAFPQQVELLAGQRKVCRVSELPQVVL